MGKMRNEQILAFAKEFADRIYEIGWYSLGEEVIRTRDITISIDFLVRLAEARSNGFLDEYKKMFRFPDGWYESEDKLEDIIPKVAENEAIEAVIFCEGELWETLYYCEAYGRNDKKTKAMYETFVKTVHNHNLRYEWGEGIVFLYGVSECVVAFKA